MKLRHLIQADMLIDTMGRNPRFSRNQINPVELAFIESSPSPSWKLYSGFIPRKRNQRAARIGNGTRRGRALLNRLDAQAKATRSHKS